jgi:hypothetical protein
MNDEIVKVSEDVNGYRADNRTKHATILGVFEKLFALGPRRRSPSSKAIR